MINKIFGFRTNNLYLGELKVHKTVRYDGYLTEIYQIKSFEPKKYVLVRKKGDKYFKDIFTRTKFKNVNYCSNGEVGLNLNSSIVTNKPRISYKDAEEILTEYNPVLIKNN